MSTVNEILFGNVREERNQLISELKEIGTSGYPKQMLDEFECLRDLEEIRDKLYIFFARSRFAIHLMCGRHAHSLDMEIAADIPEQNHNDYKNHQNITTRSIRDMLIGRKKNDANAMKKALDDFKKENFEYFGKRSVQLFEYIPSLFQKINGFSVMLPLAYRSKAKEVYPELAECTKPSNKSKPTADKHIPG